MSASGIKRDGTVLGFDVGARRIGVAVGSAFGHGARALAVVDVHGHGPDWALIDRLHKEWRPDGLIVGDPMTLDGGDQPIRVRAHAFARELQARYGLPVVLVDERSSSQRGRAALCHRTCAGPQAPPRCRGAGCRGGRRHRRALAGRARRWHPAGVRYADRAVMRDAAPLPSCVRNR